MLISLRGLICDMKSFGNKVNGMSTEVYNQTEIVNLSMNDISEAMREVALGIQNQAQETETSTNKMLSLSNNINAVTDKANIMVQTADSKIAAIEQGKTIVSAINKKSAHTVEITKILVENIRDVENLKSDVLDLNASINNFKI